MAVRIGLAALLIKEGRQLPTVLASLIPFRFMLVLLIEHFLEGSRVVELLLKH
jgi:hypothetical protein